MFYRVGKIEKTLWRGGAPPPVRPRVKLLLYTDFRVVIMNGKRQGK